MDYKLTLILNRFQQTRIIDVENEVTGDLEKGIFIPFKWNDIRLGRKGNVYAFIAMFERDDFKFKETHNLSCMWNSTFRKEMDRLGVKRLQIGHANKMRKKYSHARFEDEDPIEEAL
jgi:hypothetical protein